MAGETGVLREQMRAIEEVKWTPEIGPNVKV
jgi:hypothetical protein